MKSHRRRLLPLACWLLLFSASAVEAQQQVQVTASKANIRLEPNASSAVVMSVPIGAVLPVVASQGEWHQVELPADASGFKRMGYIHASVVKPLAVQPAPSNTGTDAPVKAASPGTSAPETPSPIERPADTGQRFGQASESNERKVKVGVSLEQTSTEAVTGEQAGIYLRTSEGLVPVEPAVFSGQRTGGFFSALTELVPRGRHAALRSSRAQLRVPTSTPAFYFYFENAGAGLSNTGPGMFTGFMNGASSPNEFVLVKLEQKENQREVDLGRDWIFGSRGGVNFDDVVEIGFERLQTGVYRVTPARPLEPGAEYAFFYAAGAGVVQEQGTGKLFDFGFDSTEER